MSKTVSFQTIQFSISTQFSSIWPIDKTLSGATTQDQSGPGNDGGEGVLNIPQSSCMTRTLQSDGLMSYPGLLLRGSYPSKEMLSMYSAAQADWANRGFKKNLIMTGRWGFCILSEISSTHWFYIVINHAFSFYTKNIFLLFRSRKA